MAAGRLKANCNYSLLPPNSISSLPHNLQHDLNQHLVHFHLILRTLQILLAQYRLLPHFKPVLYQLLLNETLNVALLLF